MPGHSLRRRERITTLLVTSFAFIVVHSFQAVVWREVVEDRAQIGPSPTRSP